MFQQQLMPTIHVLYESKDSRHRQRQNLAQFYDEPKDQQDTRKQITHEKKLRIMSELLIKLFLSENENFS